MSSDSTWPGDGEQAWGRLQWKPSQRVTSAQALPALDATFSKSPALAQWHWELAQAVPASEALPLRTPPPRLSAAAHAQTRHTTSCSSLLTRKGTSGRASCPSVIACL